MKRMLAVLTLSSALAFVWSAVGGADNERKSAPSEALIREVLNAQVKAWNSGKLEEFMTGYWQSNDLTFYSGKDKRQGWNETLERYRKRYQGEGKEMGKLSFAELEIQVLSAEHALVKGRWQLELKDAKPEGLFTLIMRKTEQGWKIVHDHTSN